MLCSLDIHEYGTAWQYREICLFVSVTRMLNRDHYIAIYLFFFFTCSIVFSVTISAVAVIVRPIEIRKATFATEGLE